MNNLRRRISKVDYVVRSTVISTSTSVLYIDSLSPYVSWVKGSCGRTGNVGVSIVFYGIVTTTYRDYYSSGATKTRVEQSSALRMTDSVASETPSYTTDWEELAAFGDFSFDVVFYCRRISDTLAQGYAVVDGTRSSIASCTAEPCPY